jgi:hypothetical protein
MWSLLRVCPFSLFLASVGALAQPAADPSNTILPYAQLPNTAPQLGTASEEEIRTKSAQWHTECIGDWDRQTHMTKKEWANTCQRVVDARVKWLRNRGNGADLYAPLTGNRYLRSPTGINH